MLVVVPECIVDYLKESLVLLVWGLFEDLRCNLEFLVGQVGLVVVETALLDVHLGKLSNHVAVTHDLLDS